MIENPKISIITVALNSQSTIAQTIESVFAQDYNNVEYILIDGGSNDWTLDIINNYVNDIDYFISEVDNGIYDAMNKGIKASTGDIVGILNSDDVYENNFVLSDIARIFSQKEIDCLYGDLVYVKTSNASEITRYWKSGSFNQLKLNTGWMLPHPTLFVKKELYTLYGVYNTELKSAADYEIILRFLKKYNSVIEYLPKILVKMREGGYSNSSMINRLRANQEDLLAWKVNDMKPPLFVRILKPLRKISQFFIKPS